MSTRSIHLHGALGQFSADPIELAVADIHDVFSGLKSRFKTFKAFMHEHPGFVIVLTDKGATNPRPVMPEFVETPFSDCEEIHLFNTIEGAGITEAITAALVMYGEMAYGTAAFIASVIVNVGVSIALGVVAQMLSPQVQGLGGTTQSNQSPSFLYNGPVNVVEQGYQVPIIYGSTMTGSVVVSAGISVEQLPVAAQQADRPANGGGFTQPANPSALPWQYDGGGD